MLWRSNASKTTSTRQPPPPPIFTPPHRTSKTHNPLDRNSVGSSNSASTSSTRSTILLVSPTTPTRAAWLSDPSPLEFLVPPNVEVEDWDVSTPTNLRFGVQGGDERGMDGKGDTKSWWAGTTPTGKRRTIELESGDVPRVMSYHSAALGESPTLGRRSLYSVLDEQLDEEALGESPTLGEVDRMNEELDLFSPSRITTPCALDDSPTIPISLLPNIKSTTIPRREVPVVSIVDDYMMGKEEWSAKRLGKLPQERYNQLGLFGNINDQNIDIHPKRPLIHPRGTSSSSLISLPSTSSIKSTSTGKSVKPVPAIPSRSSSKRLSLVYPAANPRQPPKPPARGSSLRSFAIPPIPSVPVSHSTESLTSIASSSTNRSVRFGSNRSVSSPVQYVPLATPSTSTPPAVRPVRRRTTTSSSFSTLETVPEAPRDLDVPPDPAWALRERPLSRLGAIQSRSQPDLHDHLSGTMMQKLRLKRNASAATFGDKTERRKSAGASSLLGYGNDETMKKGDKEGFMKTFTIRRSDKSRATSRALPSDWKHTKDVPTLTNIFNQHETQTPPRVELAFVPSRPAPAPPIDIADFDGCDEIHGEWYQSTIRAISIEASRAMRDAENWMWPFPPTRSPSTINTSESGSSLGGPITPSSSSFTPNHTGSGFQRDSSEMDTPTQGGRRVKSEHEAGGEGRDCLHGEEEFSRAQRKRMSMRIGVAEAMESSRKQNRLSLAPAWNGGMI